MNLRTFRTIQGCPVYADICPYIAIIINDSKQRVTSIYRGRDAAAILHKHGKHTDDELYWLSIHGTVVQRRAVGLPPEGGGVNRPDQTTHNLRNDGVAYPQLPVRAHLPWWGQGWDVDESRDPHAVDKVIAAAHKYGWEVVPPYSSGREHHHLNFRVQPRRPRPGTRLWARLWRIRWTYPRT